MKLTNNQNQLVTEFLAELTLQQFSGDIETRLCERLISATDNSIYQILPQAIVHPRNNEDVTLTMKLLSDDRFKTLTLAPRGGGTGTNGQSLTNGIVLDLSRHMNEILDFDETSKTVSVQAGVVKDQLNAYLKPLGYFFAPELSTSNRATIGGMINTDASGQGSCAYGKTSQHVESITAIIRGGELIRTKAFSNDDLKRSEDSVQTSLLSSLTSLINPQKKIINEKFPKLNRFITGYDLHHFVEDNYFNLNHLLCGSEGTLGVFTEATLNVLPIPKETALVLVSYNGFIKALEDAPYLMTAKVTSIEIIDDIVLNLAKNDYIWATTEHYFKDVDYNQLKAIQLIEFNADTKSELQQLIDQFIIHCQKNDNINRLSIHPIMGKEAVNAIYGLRKRAVGLLGALKGNRRPIPFVEDTAVPPENLAQFITEFKQILDKHNLRYGMFGHADAGVIHVRPALDMRKEDDRPLIRDISDKVFALCQKYGGALWGEHGKGVRSEYSKVFFGELYPTIQAVKHIFDPYNQLNPGKIATSNNDALLKIDELPLRGEFNQSIRADFIERYQETLHCNGNGACFNYDLDAVMCPSYKATRNRLHSPKGRSELIKEWLRLRSLGESNTSFEKELYESFTLCLSCKSCTGECPVKVNIPDAKSEFLNEYHKTQKRPFYEKLLAQSEKMASLTYKFRYFYSPLAGNIISRFVFNQIGLVDLPLPQSNHLPHYQEEKWVEILTEDSLSNLDKIEDKSRTVIIIPDTFFNYYDAATLNATIELLHKLEVQVFLAPYKNSGKVYHVLGMLEEFENTATKQNVFLKKLSQYDIPMVGIEPAVTLLYRDEYRQKLNLDTPDINLIQEWLFDYLKKYHKQLNIEITETAHYQLLSHCTEKTNATHAPKIWENIFSLFKSQLTLTKSGCCGMGGTFGHIKNNQKISRKIYDQSWQKIINKNEESTLLATGFSCRTQVNRFSEKTIVHPIVKLNEIIRAKQQ